MIWQATLGGSMPSNGCPTLSLWTCGYHLSFKIALPTTFDTSIMLEPLSGDAGNAQLRARLEGSTWRGTQAPEGG